VQNGGRQNVVVFGADWCGDCRQAKAWLRNNHVSFTDVDVETDEQARARAVELAKGRRNLPVVLLPDGSVLIEPTDAELARALGPSSVSTP
jgi:mycoredoxin